MVEKDIEKRIIDKINGLGIKDMGVLDFGRMET